MNSGQNKFTCDRCKGKFLTSILLEVHVKEAHVEGGEYGCGECSCVFKTPDKLNAHQVQEHGYIECVPQFKPKKAETTVEGKCKFCRITFHNTAMLKSHLRRKHADEYESSESDEDEFEEDSEPEDVSPKKGNKDDKVDHGIMNGDSGISSVEASGSGSLDGAKEQVEPTEKPKETEVITNNANHVEKTSKEKELPEEREGLERGKSSSNGSIEERHSSLGGVDTNEKGNALDDVMRNTPDFEAGSDQDDFEPPTNFLIQNDYEVEPEEAQIRSSNIEQLINSIEDDGEDSDVHRCHLCSSDYATLDALLAHQKTNHVAGGQFPCENCACVFASRPELIVHSEIIHRTMRVNHFLAPEFADESKGEEQHYSCEMCGQEFSEALQLTIHKMRNHVARGHKCRSCSSSFMSKAELGEHIQHVHGQYRSIPSVVQASSSPSQGFMCTICDVDYKSNSALRNHTKACHVPGGQFPCPECPCVLGSSKSLQSHVVKHKRAPTAYSSPRSASSRVSVSSTSDTMQICACEICGVNFINTLDYLTHKEESHVAGGKYGCQDCPCIFSSFETLKTHRNVFHGHLQSPGVLGSELLQQAYETPVTSFDPEVIQLESTKRRPNILRQYSAAKAALVTVTSTKEMCSLCGTTLRSKQALKTHLEKSHVPNGYKCNICSCSWATYHAMKTHVGQIHKGVPFSEEVYTPPQDIVIENHVGASSKNKGRRSDVAGEEEMEFKCTECDWTLADATDLQNHKIQFHGFKPKSNSVPVVDEVGELIKNDDPLTCSACNLTFRRPSETYSHRKRYHVTGGKYPCKFCKCVFGTSGSLQAHEVSKHTDELMTKPPPHKKIKTSHGIVTTTSEKQTSSEEFVCNLCGRAYSVYQTLCAHKSRSHKTTGVACSYCTCMFSNKADLSLHNKKYHRQVRFPPDLLSVDATKRGKGGRKSSAATTSERFTCQYKNCQVACRNQSILSAHVKKFHAAQIEVVILDDAFKCEICNISFENRHDLAAHRTNVHDYDVVKMAIEKTTVTPDGKYRCHFCSTIFSRQSAMVAHVKTFHMEENKFLCFDCSEEFSEMSELEQHRRQFHDVVKSISQEEEDVVPIITSCTSLSSGPTGYDKPKQPRCELCGRVFLHSRSLWSHRKRSHVTEGDFTCVHCSCGFATSRGLRNHQLIYHGIRLDCADSAAKDAPWLIDCDLCDETFTSTRRLKSHQKRAHVKDGEYPCADCYNVYGTKCSLNVHRIKVHGVELPPLPEPPMLPQQALIKKAVISSKSRTNLAQAQSDIQFEMESGYSPPHDADADYEPEWDNDMDIEITSEKRSGKSSPVRRSESIRSEKTDSDRKYICDFENCNLKFGFLKFLISHRKMRHDIEEKQCPVCNQIFPTMDALIDHTDEAHGSSETSVPDSASMFSNQEYQCDLCDMIFSLSSSLNMHKTTSHVKNGQFPCPVCPCVFGTSANLSSHKTVHALRDKMKNNEKNSPQKIEYKRAPDITPTRKRGRPKSQPPTHSPQKQQIPLKSPPKPENQGPAGITQRSVARKKTSLPPTGAVSTNTDILGLAFSAAMNDATPRCATCKRTNFTSASAMRRHETECRKRAAGGSTGKSGKPGTKSQARTPTLMACKLCPKKFTLAAALKDHMHKKHNPDADTNAPSSTFVEQIDLDSDGSDEIINAGTASKRQRGSTAPAVPPRPPTPPPPPPPPPKKRKTKFPCKECNIIFPRKRILENHSFICHVKTGAHNCDACTCKFNIALGLHFHKKHAHKIGKKAAVVAQNGTPSKKKTKGKSKKKNRARKKIVHDKGFFSPKALKSRERLISWNEVMHPCKVCAMKFRFTTQLARHENINHPGQPEYLCEKCPSMTSLSKELKYHEEIYHSHYLSMGEAIEQRQKRLIRKKKSAADSAVAATVKPKRVIKLKPLKLDENLPLDLSNVIASYTCTPGLSVQDELRIKENFLRRKLKRRKGIFMCRVCRMMFFTKRGLSFHLRVHVGEKPFKCRYCGVLFRHYGPYLMHKKKHVALQPKVKDTVERNPLGRCSYCKATFRTVTLADIHFEEVHPELKFLDMCEQASNLWKETSVLKSGDNFQLI